MNDGEDSLSVKFAGQAAVFMAHFDAIDSIGEFCEAFFDHIAHATQTEVIWKDKSVLNQEENDLIAEWDKKSRQAEDENLANAVRDDSEISDEIPQGTGIFVTGFESYDVYLQALIRIHGDVAIARHINIFLINYKADDPQVMHIPSETFAFLNMPTLDKILSIADQLAQRKRLSLVSDGQGPLVE